MKVKKLISVAILLILVLVSSYFLFHQREVCIEENCFQVEIAETIQERSKGLSNRESLDLNKGMLFVMSQKTIPRFWMKKMEFPLDIIWINSDLEIIGIEKDLQPCVQNEVCPTFSPEEKILYVLEINSGLSDEYNFAIGDRVNL